MIHRDPGTVESRVYVLSERLEHIALYSGEGRSTAASALMVAAVRILCEDFEPRRAAAMLRAGIDQGVAAFHRRKH